MTLSHEARTILAAIVREYIVAGEAVGSRKLVMRHGIGKSPATVRSVMADLEQQGLLHQPHTSAGRVPTESGLRFYVDRLMQARELTEEEKQQIASRFAISGGELQQLLREISRLLADVSQQCAVVLSPRGEASLLRRIEFVPIEHGKLIAVLVMSSGVVQNRLVCPHESFLPHELQQVHNYLNELCSGRELGEVRRLVQQELENEQTRYDRVVARALEVGAAALETPMEDDLVIEGKERLLDLPQVDREQLKALMRGIENRRLVLRLLDETMQADGVRVFIGAETKQEELRNCAMVVASYGRNKPLGTLGVIGPSHMDYPRLVPLVDYTAGILTRLIDG